MDTKEIARQMLQIINTPCRVSVNLKGFVGYNPAAESADLEKAIVARGGKILSARERGDVGSFTGGGVIVVRYDLAGENRTAYILNSCPSGDDPGQESIILTQPFEPESPASIEDAFALCRAAARAAWDAQLEALRDLDRLVPRGFRSVLAHKASREVAGNIYRNHGALTQAVFEPFRGTAAYPTKEEAVCYFDAPLRKHPPIEAYMAVGELYA